MYLYYSISKGTREPKGSIVWLCAHRINQILLLITVDLNKWDSVFSLICRGMGEQSKFLPKLKVETSPVDTKLCFNPQCTLILMFVICRWLFAFHECRRILFIWIPHPLSSTFCCDLLSSRKLRGCDGLCDAHFSWCCSGLSLCHILSPGEGKSMKEHEVSLWITEYF